MFRIAICDDEATSLILNKSLTEKIMQEQKIDYEIETFESMGDLLDVMMRVKPTQGFDVLLSDILTTEINGIDAAKKIRKLGEQVDIIFISSTAEYALEGYQVQALRYLKKPVELDKLKEALMLSYSKHADKDDIRLFVDGNEISVKYEDIYYVESTGRDVEISLGDRKIVTHEKISDMEKYLPEKDFIRCHRSYIVNLAKMQNIERYVITMKNGEQIVVSQQLYSDTRFKFYKYQ